MSTGSDFSRVRELYPVPKSSMATFTPMPFRASMVVRAVSMSFTTRLSVISRHSDAASIPYSAMVAATLSANPSRRRVAPGTR